MKYNIEDLYLKLPDFFMAIWNSLDEEEKRKIAQLKPIVLNNSKELYKLVESNPKSILVFYLAKYQRPGLEGEEITPQYMLASIFSDLKLSKINTQRKSIVYNINRVKWDMNPKERKGWPLTRQIEDLKIYRVDKKKDEWLWDKFWRGKPTTRYDRANWSLATKYGYWKVINLKDNYSSNKFINWSNENPLEMKE